VTDHIHLFKDCYRDLVARKEEIHLLLGNGFSIGASAKFRYSSLFEQAQLGEREKELFQRRQTKNFEEMLKYYEDALDMNSFYDLDCSQMIIDREEIRNGLVSAVSKVHPDRRRELDEKAMQRCQVFISRFNNIFTFNYDLLLYWVCMNQSDQFSDGFVSTARDCVFSKHISGRKGIYYLHGAIHLYENKQRTFKRRASNDKSIVEVVREAVKRYRHPLFISEGEADLKKQRIAASPYLSECWKRFRNIQGALFVYGHSLSAADQHVVEAITENRRLNHLFVGLHTDQQANSKIKQTCQVISESRKDLNIRFYHSRGTCVWEPERRKQPREKTR